MGVPNFLKFPAMGDPGISSATFFAISRTFSGSATASLPAPRTAMARKFFDPMTAPMPVRPLACFSSLSTHA
jgi:hypothetical protein